MPVIRRRGGYSWGRTGRIYSTREQAERVGRAIMAMKRKTKKRGGRKTKSRGGKK